VIYPLVGLQLRDLPFPAPADSPASAECPVFSCLVRRRL
jgi:hypothetical protein